MREGYWVIRKYCCGPVGESIKFWMPGRRPERMTRQVRRDVQRIAKNTGSAIRQAARVVNLNFGEGDGLVGLDYTDAALAGLMGQIPDGVQGEEREKRLYDLAEHQMDLMIRRAQRAAEKDGIALMYFKTTSDRDWDERKKVWVPARIHHHLILNEEAKPYVFAAWKHGGVDWKPLSPQPDYTPVVAYLIEQVRHRADKNKYRTSRNLERPAAKDRLAAGGAELRPPRGAVLLDRGAYVPGQPQYIRYILPAAYETERAARENGVLHVTEVPAHRREEKRRRRGSRGA